MTWVFVVLVLVVAALAVYAISFDCPAAIERSEAAASVLLTDAAVRAAWDDMDRLEVAGISSREERLRAALAMFLHHHATEGREALVQRVLAESRKLHESDLAHAEAVVTALFGAYNKPTISRVDG